MSILFDMRVFQAIVCLWFHQACCSLHTIYFKIFNHQPPPPPPSEKNNDSSLSVMKTTGSSRFMEVQLLYDLLLFYGEFNHFFVTFKKKQLSFRAFSLVKTEANDSTRTDNVQLRSLIERFSAAGGGGGGSTEVLVVSD